MDKKIIKLAIAGLIYACFAFYLYCPHLKNLPLLYHILPVNLFLGSFGCFILSRRWIGSFFGGFFAGAIYGFGSFFLGLSFYHPLAGTMAAAIPWLFWPAAFLTKDNRPALQAVLCILPFLAIVTFFQLARQFGFFPVPLQTRLHPADLIGLISGLVAANQNLTLIGFYHVPIAAMVMGCFMMAAAKRYTVMLILAAGIAGGFGSSVFGVSPVMWVSISAVCLSILIGVGMQGLAISGSADGKILVAVIIVMLSLAVACTILAAHCTGYFAGLGSGYANLFRVSTKMYLLGAAAVGIIYFLAKTKLPGRWIRWAILIFAMTLDIFFSAIYIIDNIF